MHGRRTRLLAFAALIALAVASCGGSSGRSGSSGATLRIGTSSKIDQLNPYIAFSTDSYTTFEYIYPFLVQYDQDLEFAPDFAESWESSKDGLTWTFHTVSGAKWSDGDPLTAEDAAWTINTDLEYAGGAAAALAGLVAHIDKAEAPNPNTLVVHYESPVANVLSQFQQLAILPEHIWSEHTGNDGKDLKTFPNDAPVVSGGPFELVDYRRNDIALFERNPNFYGQAPRIDGFGLEIYSNDDALLTGLKAGEIDLVESVPPTGLTTLENAGMVIDEVPGVAENDFIFNSNPQKPERRELLDERVKEALAHAIDRDRMVEIVSLDHAQPAASIITPATGEWHNPSIEPETFDLGLANRMLDELGYKRGPEGIRIAGDHQMDYEVIMPNNLTGADRTFQIIQGDFEQIGVRLTQKSLDSSAALDAIGSPNFKYLDFDLAMWDWVGLIDPDFMLSVVTCDQYGGWSDTGYCDPAYDKLYQKQGVTLDEDERKQIVWKMQQMIYEARPYIMLTYENWITAYSPQWEGFVSSPQGVFNSLSKQSLIEAHPANSS